MKYCQEKKLVPHGMIGKHLVLIALTILSITSVSATNRTNDNTNAPEDSWRYTVMLNGTDVMKLEMPCYDDTGYDSWIDKGYVYITIEGTGNRETLFYYESDDKSDDFPDVWGYKGVEGDMVLSRDQNYSSINVTNSKAKWSIPKVSGTNYSILHLTWSIPDKYRGKTVTISWDIHKTGNGPAGPAGESSKTISINSSNIQIPEMPALISPSVQAPMLGYDAAHAGQMMLVYTMPSSNIKSLTAYYVEMNGTDELNRMMELENNVSGYIYLPVDRCYKNFYLVANYIDTEKKERTTQSQPFDLAMLHNAASLNASLQSNGKVRLNWVMPDRNWHDLMENDFWEIQRCTSDVPSLNSQWVTIGQLAFNIGTQQYEFIDEDLISAYEGKPVHYRVRRTCTSLWDWASGTFAITQIAPTLYLPAIQSATVERNIWTDQQHSLSFDFTMDAPGLTVKGGGLAYDERGQAVLHTAKDWNTFASLVNSGQTNLNAIMTADIDLGESLPMVGTTSNRYAGTFNGNGHTLTFNPAPPTEGDTVAFNEEYAAPFRYVSSATIRNLHVTGQISSSKKFIGGLVAQVNDGSTLTIKNCHSSVRLISSVKGDATNGGFVALSLGSATTNISDCLFDGSFEGAECHSNGGFIGYANHDVYISHSLFAPTNLLTLTNNCDNYVRTSYIHYYHVTNCYSLKSYKAGSGSDIIVSDTETDSQGRFIINNTDDWQKFVSKVGSSGGQAVNAVLNADITLGSFDRLTSTYHGVFDGNGHTINVIFANTETTHLALFSRAKDYTIKNLHVTGSITGGIHSAGLVGSSESSIGSRNYIQNCRVSVTVSCNSTHAGGFIGHAGSSSNTIDNCLFDGKISFWLGGAQYAGAFIGWENGGTNNAVTNCLEKGAYSSAHAGMNYTSSGSAYGNVNANKNNWCYSNWGEALKVGTLTPDELVLKLGFPNWSAASGEAIPIMHKSMLADLSKTDLLKALGNGWQLVSGQLMPIMSTSDNPAHATIIWDDRAKVVLNTEKYLGYNEPDIPSSTFAIRNETDWTTFVNKVNEAGGASDVDAILLADISVTETVGTAEAPYRGSFDGYGHTLNLNIDKAENFIAPFRYVAHTTNFKNLTVTGEITGNSNTSGLVGHSADGGTLTIENCRVSAHVYTNGGNVGGFIGHGNSATNIIRNCLFDGGLKNHSFTYLYFSCAGAFIGAITIDGYYKQKVENNLEHGTYLNFSSTNANILQIDANTVEGFAGTNTWAYTLGGQYSSINVVPSDMSAELLVSKLDKTQWKVDAEGSVVPIMPESKETILYTEQRELTKEEIAAGRFTQQLNTSCVNHRFNFAVEQGSSKLSPISTESVVPQRTEKDKGFAYTFNNNVKLTSLKADTLQTAVTLTWEATGLGDYYRIIRYDKMTQQTDTLEATYDQMSYMDRTPQPQHAYVYTIEGVTQCEGTHVSALEITAGCAPTGMVRGYLRLADGTAMAGVTVKASPKKGNFVGAVEKTTKTDEAGFFEISGLIYQGSATYEISVETTGEMQAMDALSATFDDTKNLISNLRFTQSNYYRFSGQVAYEGTSVPVVGAQFERDGAIVKNGSGQPIITDSQGKFTLSVPQGSHTIRVVKEGHVFADDGFHIDPDASDPTKHNWQKEVSDYTFWDQTRVTLQGRVVGGDDQGNLPLGQSLSRNNLGDSITIVMQLEGDNASYLVRDQLNASITELHRTIPFGITDTCNIDVYRHRLVIRPDAKTGEYAIPMIPVKFKVTEVYAQGYATLFQTGEVGQTIDLTPYVNKDTVTWNRIYHAPPTLAVKQYNMTGENYFGIKQYTDMDNTGNNYSIELWNDSAGYSFKHPVFMAGSPVILMLAAVEQYYKNNDSNQYIPDVVHLPGGRVYIKNGLVGTTNTTEIKLDSIGEAVYSFTPQNLTFTEEGDMALKTLTISLEYDSTFYDIKPLQGEILKGFVLASKPVAQGRRVVSDGGTCLIDILRDPPGTSSSAYIESGTKLNYSFTQSVTTKAGVNLSFSRGGGSSWYNGVFAGTGAGNTVGQINNVSSTQLATLPIVATYYNNWQYNYTFETTERISTATGQLSIGRDADVFIGMTRNAILEDAIAVRAISDDTYQMIKAHEGGTFSVDGCDFNVRQGTMKALAQGTNSKGEKVWIVRDEVLQLSTYINSTFVHSQSYIEKELIPELINIRNSLLLAPGTSEATAQAIANQQGFPAYISKVNVEDENYASEGYYTQVNPTTANASTTDSIQTLNRNILTWIGFLAVNEREKVEATDLVKSYDVDGRSSVSYNEAFTLAESQSRYFLFPLIQGTGGFSTGSFAVKAPTKGTHTESAYGQDNGMTIDINTFGTSLSIKMSIVASLDYNYNYGKTETQTKKVGFTLSPSTKSNLLVDVYRTQANTQIFDQRRAALLDAGYKEEDIDKMLFMYASEDFIKNIKIGDNAVPGTLGGMCSYMTSTPTMYRSLVFRTRGGATCGPYEDERRTKYYNPGTLLDAKTIEIDRLRIWADEQTVSNVPYDEPARFTIHLANESEAPALATEVFTYFLNDPSNVRGAKIQIEGVPLSGSGSAVYIPAGSVVTKQVELYPGAEFDYENVGISLFDSNDKKRVQTVYLSAHFVPTAGKVNISLPGDKWVVNTESQFDARLQQYYMPVVIDGFDVNYRGFDHIELQYKLANQGDKEWVNVCSFYKDSLLMAKASGVCQLIENDGRIVANFYGENDPIEQEYNLRAVSYCRHGGGFLTRSSDILTGIKDTRRPQLFGMPKPEDGILDIGEDIMLRFSEQIAGNYLRELNNFQVLGQTNSSNIVLSTDLRFNGYGFATSQSTRNLAGKSFTVDLLLNPDNNGKAMSFFAHGENGNYLELGLTADRHLMVAFAQSDTTGLQTKVYTSAEPVSFNGMHQVLYTFESDIKNQTTTISFYDGTKRIGSFVHPQLYEGYGLIQLGQGGGLVKDNGFYEGEMLEFRLWNRVLSPSEMSDYSLKKLTGYELGLLDNFPLNEGRGEYSYNRVSSGSDLNLYGTTWKVPDGIGMKLDGTNGFRLKPDKFKRWDHQDYTLMFWFQTADDSGTLLANGRAEDEAEASEHFRFSVNGGMLNLNISGLKVSSNMFVNDGQWHHAALTINRSSNLGCLYVDNLLRSTFAVDTLGGISGNNLAAGALYDGSGISEPINGHIDEIAMFEMALPTNSIKSFSNATPTGEEMGLMAYLNFSQSELQMNGQQRLMPTGVSLKRYKDLATGQLTAQRDTIVAQDVIERLADRALYAPMSDAQTLENIKYSFVADGKDLLINLDVPDERIEKTNVYIVVRDVADLQGNLMASPVALDLYVYRNPLRWNVKRLALTPKYGEEYTFQATVQNLSGKTHRYTLEGLPLWLTASQTSGSVGALDEETITFTISPYINIGEFDEVINLMGEEGMNEPLPINIKVRGDAPDWTVDQALLHANITMNVIARVEIGGSLMNDPEDRLAVFGENHRTLGVSKLNAADGNFYLTIYNSSAEETPLRYEFFDASTGIIHVLISLDEVRTFKRNTVVGTPDNPYIFKTNNAVVQTIHLQEGWNWISFNVQPEVLPVGELLNSATKWEVRDGLEVIRPDGTYAQIAYKQFYNPDDPKNPTYAWDEAETVVELDAQQMYRFYSNSEKTAYISGNIEFPAITVKPNWNRIGYISSLNLPIGTALADYTDRAAAGDIIKSQSEFAVLTIDASGNRSWRGTLQFMKVGEGYMLKRNADDIVTFMYPTYFGQSRYNGNTTMPSSYYVNNSGTSMTVVAKAKGIEAQEGDVLTAYRGAEVCGIAVADADGVFFLNVGDAEAASDELSFTLEREEEIIGQATGRQMYYAPNAALGTPDLPTAINFVESREAYGEGWYTVSGIRLNKRPTEVGVYIYNNEKVMIK
ncbi:MAG: hypothetical protein IKI05_07380 [Bacteroidaceae bacterium]|nr:hypothetical protein [Bacteroidaceae bacterium]